MVVKLEKIVRIGYKATGIVRTGLDWNVTYTIIKQDENDWVIKDGEHTIARCSQEYTDENNKKEIELVSKKGTEFHITPIDKTHIKFQQISKDGTLGTTDAVEFVKKQY